MAVFKNQDVVLGDNNALKQDAGAMESPPAICFSEGGESYELECLTSLDAVEKIANDWKTLERECAQPYIYFQTYDWIFHWCNIFTGPTSESDAPKISIYTLRCNGVLVMVWPMMLEKSQAGQKNLTFLSEPHGQYSNVICDQKRCSVDVGKIVWKHICKNKDADAVTLDQYPKSSILKSILEGKGYVENFEKFSSVLNLEAFDTWDEYRASLGRKTRKQRNQRYNKLAKQGEIEYQIHYGGSNDYRQMVDLALKWKVEWLAETGRRATVLSMDTTKQFLANLTGTPAKSTDDQAVDAHGAVLAVLKVGGVPIGIEIGMCLDGHYYCYLGAFDWAHRDMSPGKVQMELSQKWAKEAGLRKFDLLGEPADYKTSWSDTEDALESRSVPLTLRGYLYSAVWKAYLRPWVRGVFNNLDSGKRVKLLQLFGIGKTQGSSKNKSKKFEPSDRQQKSPSSQT